MMKGNPSNSVDMESFEKQLKKLQSVEREAVRYFDKLKNPNNSEKLWYDIHPIWTARYDQIKSMYPEKWKQYCNENNLVTNYTFGDVLA